MSYATHFNLHDLFYLRCEKCTIMKHLFWVDLVEFWKKLEIVLDVKKCLTGLHDV